MYASLQDLFRTRLSVEYNSEEISFDTLLRVELGFRLLEILGLEHESVLTVWALNQGLDVPALSTLHLNSIQRRWLANFRVLIHRSSLRDWQNDFSDYAHYDEARRVYGLPVDDPTFERACFSRTGRQPQRVKIFDETLGEALPYRKEKRNYATAGKYAFSIDRAHKGELELSERILKEAHKNKIIRLGKRRERHSVRYSFNELCELARELDLLEQSAGQKRLNKWLDRMERIVRFRARQIDGLLSIANTVPLIIDGMTPIAGMVGSGKSTIATLIAYDIARHQKAERVTLVVADVAEVLRLTEYFNSLFATEKPIAIPLLGSTMRESHLISVFRQKDFVLTNDKWKLRFLDTTCLVTQWLSDVDDTAFGTVTPGSEPCNSLYESNDQSERKKTYLCPLFSVCPVHQAYRDMPSASIWITTMGGLGQAKAPAQIDDRRPSLWLVIYENSSLVIFDEVDAIQGWFDKLLAPDLTLDNNTATGGLLQDTLRKLGTYPSGTFRQNADLDRWRQTYDLTMPALRNFLGLLERNEDLRNWLSVRPFTSLRILSELAARISGQFLWEDGKPPKEVEQFNTDLENLFRDMQRHELSAIDLAKPDAKDELILLSMQITSYGRGQINQMTGKVVEEWIQKQMNRVPRPLREEISHRAQSYNKKHSTRESGDPLSISKLAHRLELGLVASILDRDLRGLFYGWHHVQELLGQEGMPSLIPTSLSGLLPSPPLGRWRGFRTASEDDSKKSTLSLAIFEFAAVGRYFVQNFDRLLQDLDGQDGPNVLFQSVIHDLLLAAHLRGWQQTETN